MSYLIDNNVLCTLHTSIVPATVSIVVDAGIAPNKTVPAPSGGNIATLTLVDQVVSPTAVEIITYTTATNNGDGTFTLTGVTRGTEGTAPQTFAANSICFQAITAATMSALVSAGSNTLLQFCGDGSDGDATVSTAISLTADTYYRNLTITSSGSINTSGYGLYVSGVLDITAAVAGAIFAPGGTSANSVSGSVGTAGGIGGIGVTVPGGSNGGTGGSIGSQLGGVGIAFVAAIGGAGGAGGRAGASGAANGGIGGNYATTNYRDIRRPGAPLIYSNGASMALLGGGMGGGAGGSGTPANTAGAGGGGGGSALVLYAATIATSASTPVGVIKGGTGGSGGGSTGGSGGGAGAGGGSGPVVVGYGNRVGPTITGAIKTTGGQGGPQSSSSSYAFSGDAGVIHVYNLLTGTGVTAPRVAGTQGIGTPTAGAINSANL